MLPSVQPNEGQVANMAMKKVIINRKRWGKNKLRRGQDLKQCCLGFVCEAYGVPQVDMTGKGMPYKLPAKDRFRLPKWLTEHPSRGVDVSEAAVINDSNTPWAKKEEKLKPIFRKHGIQLIFRSWWLSEKSSYARNLHRQ